MRPGLGALIGFALEIPGNSQWVANAFSMDRLQVLCVYPTETPFEGVFL